MPQHDIIDNRERKLVDPIRLQEMYDCLKRIRKSIQTWSKRGGRRGYLEYVDSLFPDTA